MRTRAESEETTSGPLVRWHEALYPGETAGAVPPPWVQLVEDVLDGLPDGADPEFVAADPARPFAAFADTAIAAIAPALTSAEAAGIDLGPVLADLTGWLDGRLNRLAARTLQAEIRPAGHEGGLTEPAYLASLAGRCGLARLLDRYPVLARLLAQAGLDTAAAATEMLRRLATDRVGLADGAGLLPDSAAARLTRVEPARGDLHDGGRAVALLTFDDGRRLVYKPRPLGLQARWGELLDWFAGRHPDLAPRAVRVLTREGYGWAEFIAARPCADPGQVEAFYRRQGGLLALLYALDGTDVHCENLIACADQPVVVDVETLFHPAWAFETRTGPDPATAALNRSVLRTALLPKLLLGEHGALDVSAFGAAADALGGSGGCGPITNRPVLSGRPVDPDLYRHSLTAGFRAAYQAIVLHRQELTGPDGVLAGFAGEQVRLVFRPTQTYAMLLAEAARPERLTSGRAREQVFAALAGDSGHEHQNALAASEIADLRAGDVPLFTTTTTSLDVRSAGGALLPGLLRGTGLERVAEKIRAMDAVDQGEQEWLIDATMATRWAPPAGHADGERPAESYGAVVPDAGRLLAAASRIGDDVVARACHDGERANWLGLELVDGRQWSVLPMGAGLAEGYPGTALFLAQLGALTGTSRYSELAARAVQPLPRLVEALAEHPELTRTVGSGAFFGLGGISYAIARLAGLLDDEKLAGCLPAALAATQTADAAGPISLAEGTAGGLAAALAVAGQTGLTEASALAGTLAERLVQRAGRAGTGEAGFLFGSAGVRWALGRPAGGRRIPPAAEGLGWCSGLAGTALAGLGSAGTPEEATGHLGGLRDRDADLLAERARLAPPLWDHSLCHGESGVLETLVTLAECGHAASAEVLPRLTARLLGVIERTGVHCGTPSGVPAPGLLSGLAGVGLTLLRAGFPQAVPSVARLQPDLTRTGAHAVRSPLIA